MGSSPFPFADPWRHHNFKKILERIEAKRTYASDRSKSTMRYWRVQDTFEIEETTWTKKNPEISIDIQKEQSLSSEEWSLLNFPYCPLPKEVTTHVDCMKWREAMDNYAKGRTLCQAEVQLMDNVSKDLRDGCDSMVGSPGNRKTISRNCFQHPQIDIPRILDAVATEVKSGRMAGPFPVGYIKDAKVNGFLSIIKPGGARRQVGNLAAPKGASFNDGISKESLQEWQVVMTTSQQTSDMIANSGKGSILSCSDMVAAYKCLPVKKEQRRLQVFRLLGREFIDLRLIFGDKRACLLYDRFHHCIITMLVLPEAPIPCSWLGRTIDDVTTVAPKEGRHLTERFVDTYRRTLDSLNIGAAEEDINRNKAFDSSTSGEILGIWFDTDQMTWELPKRKLSPLTTKECALAG